MSTVSLILSIVWCSSLGVWPPLTDLSPGISWRNPPDRVEETDQPAERFIILASRDERSARAEDHAAGVWEVDLRGEGKIVPRLRFDDSYTAPRQFGSDSEFPRSDLITVRYSGAWRPAHERLRLYSIDYATWETQHLHTGAAFKELFWTEEAVYFDCLGYPLKPAGLRVLRLATNEVERPTEPFRLERRLRAGGDLYLVKPVGAPPQEYAVFDAKREAIVARCDLATNEITPWDEIAFSADFSKCALHFESDLDGPPIQWDRRLQVEGDTPGSRSDWFKQHLASSLIHLLDLDSGERTLLPIRLYFVEGSGVAYTYFSGPYLSFTADDELLYVNTPILAAPVFEADEECERSAYIYDFTTGESAPAPAPISPASLGAALFGRWEPPAFLPGYLVPHIKYPYPDEHEVAYAFLRSREVEFEAPNAYNNRPVAFSRDGKRFVLKLVNSGKDEVFFVGDLEANTLRTIPAPKRLARAYLSILCADVRDQDGSAR
ncbi:MAG: hypothetical protein ACF8NJ_05855 [Phycisphaerales bacterium JB038]